jgi:hypothetical protein
MPHRAVVFFIFFDENDIFEKKIEKLKNWL